MSNGTKLFIATAITYLITRVGYWALKFNPVQNLQFWPGILLDFTIWAVIFFLTLGLLGVLTAKKT